MCRLQRLSLSLPTAYIPPPVYYKHLSTFQRKKIEENEREGRRRVKARREQSFSLSLSCCLSSFFGTYDCCSKVHGNCSSLVCSAFTFTISSWWTHSLTRTLTLFLFPSLSPFLPLSSLCSTVTSCTYCTQTNLLSFRVKIRNWREKKRRLETRTYITIWSFPSWRI